MKIERTIKVVSVLMAVISVLFQPSVASAQVPSSSNYQVPESSFSSGGDVNASSSQFSANASIGELGVGIADSFSYSAQAGLITPNEEFLELVVQTTSINLGVLQSNTTAIGEGDFYVRSYINGNYIVQTLSPSLTSEAGEVIDPITSAAAPAISTNQFGMNLVENSCPANISTDTPCTGTFGANASPAPSTAFANGEAAAGYSTAGLYQYNQGDTIAQSGSTGEAWGRTNFTISYITNISTITPAGTYKAAHDIVLLSTF